MIAPLRTLICVLVTMSCCGAFAQSCSTDVIAVPFDEKTTRGIGGLQASDFEAKMGHDTLPVVSATEALNQRLLILVDVSSGSEYPEVLKDATKVAALAQQAPAGRKVGFGIFADRLVLTDHFSADPTERSSEISQLMAQAKSLGNKSGVFDALHQGLAYFGKRQPGDTILLVTDADDNASKRNADDISKEFLSNGVRLLVVFRPRSRQPHKDFHQIVREEAQALKFLSSATGGSYTGIGYPRYLDFAWAGYMLRVTLPRPVEKPKEWTLRIRNTGGRGYRDTFIFYPQKLACFGPS